MIHNARKVPLCSLRTTQGLISLRICLRCLHTELMDTSVYVDGQRKSLSDCTDGNAHQDLRCSHMAWRHFFTLCVECENISYLVAKESGTAFPTIKHMRPFKTQIILRIRIGWSEFAVRLETLCILGYAQCPVKILIKLRGGAGRSESSPGTNAIL